MCHGHPRDHPCSHTSMIWYYCPSAHINLTTGYETPCSNVTLAPAQSSKAECPIKMCAFSNKGRRWRCCRCGLGPNQKAWCAMRTGRMGEAGRMTCDHGCCENCTEFGKFCLDTTIEERGANSDVEDEYDEEVVSWRHRSSSVSDCSSWGSSEGYAVSSPASSVSLGEEIPISKRGTKQGRR